MKREHRLLFSFLAGLIVGIIAVNTGYDISTSALVGVITLTFMDIKLELWELGR